MDGGVDVKYALSSTLRLTGTINPDFGQVEVDPAVLNLSQFETFFPEKRPFFTEGASIFSFGSGPAHFRANFNFFGPSVFYSRRIGRSPQATGNLDGDYIDAPGETTILGAAKLSGKVGNGWTIGVLDALTDSERAHVGYEPSTAASLGKTSLRDSQVVEPMTNYLVARSTKEYGNSRVGFMQRGDEVTTHAVLQYTNDEPNKYFRSRNFWIGKYQNWNFGKDLLANGIYGNWFAERPNYFYFYGWGGAEGRVLDDRKTRGGPLAARASRGNGGIGMGNDSRKKISFESWVEWYESGDSSWERGAGLSVVYRPTTSLKLTLNPHYYREFGNSQYVTQFADAAATSTYGKRYVFSGIDQHTFDLGLRADWTASSRLSFQIYLQPFVAAGDSPAFQSLA